MNTLIICCALAFADDGSGPHARITGVYPTPKPAPIRGEWKFAVDKRYRYPREGRVIEKHPYLEDRRFDLLMVQVVMNREDSVMTCALSWAKDQIVAGDWVNLELRQMKNEFLGTNTCHYKMATLK